MVYIVFYNTRWKQALYSCSLKNQVHSKVLYYIIQLRSLRGKNRTARQSISFGEYIRPFEPHVVLYNPLVFSRTHGGRRGLKLERII